MKEPLDAAAVRVFPPGVPLVTILVGVGLDRREKYLSYKSTVRRWL